MPVNEANLCGPWFWEPLSCLEAVASSIHNYDAVVPVSPESVQPELLAEILARSTTMAVTQVETGTRLERDHVFVMPPGTRMTLDGNIFCLRKAPPARGWPETINVFLYSLAEVKGSWAVAVILSGLDSDGSAALASIKAAGGVTFAQADPIVEDMPRRAVETGTVDFLLPSEEIARLLSALPQKLMQRN